MTTISNSREISLYLKHPPTTFQRDKRLSKAGGDVAASGERGVDRLSLAKGPSGSGQNYTRVLSSSSSVSPGYLLVYNNRAEGVTALSTQTAGKGGVDFYV